MGSISWVGDIMCKFGTPDDLEEYIIADRDLAIILAKNGFQVEYRDYGSSYFKKTDKLINFINKEGI